MNIQLSDHFDYKRLLAFTLPSIIMMIFTSVYSVVDGLFVSNFVGITEFGAINLIMPLAQILGCFGFMFGSGGSALVSKTLGEGNREKANKIFSLLTYVALALSVVLSLTAFVLIEDIAVLMGADEALLPHCVVYGRILLLSLPAFTMQNMFQSFLITAERPGMGLAVTIASGVTNIVLDALFIIVFGFGLAGAAVATLIAQCVGGIVPFIYFVLNKKGLLRLCKTGFNGRALFGACTNGLSEFVTNISMSVVSMLYNFQLMNLVGNDGVVAYGAVMYVSFIFVAIFIGYSIGVAPVVGFHYGAGDVSELQSLRKKSLVLVSFASIALAVAALLLSRPLAGLFVGKDEVLFEMTATAFRFYSVSVLFSGFSIFGSAFFTALNDGFVSAAISFLRTMLFQAVAVLVLPIIFGIDGIWYSLFTAEILAMAVTFAFFAANRKKYHY